MKWTNGISIMAKNKTGGNMTSNVQQFGNVRLIEIPFYLNSLGNFDDHRLLTEY